MADGSNRMTRAAYTVTVGGKDVTDKLRPRLSRLVMTSTRGGQADELELELDDTDGKLDLPDDGAELRAMIGFESSGVQLQGTYTVDDVEHRGTPDMLHITSRSAKLATGINTRKERSWSNTTVGHLIEVIAGENGLTPKVSAKLAAIAVDQIDQTESDIAMLKRLGGMWDAVATVKDGNLLFMPIGEASTVSGKVLPVATITRGAGDNHRYLKSKQKAYTGVRARWHDQDKAQGRSVLAGDKGHVKTLRGQFATEADAKREAEAEKARMARGAASFELHLAVGRPDLMPEMQVKLSGWKPKIDGVEWIVTKVVHTVDASGGYTTSIELENKAARTDHAAQDEDSDGTEAASP
jgi:Phage protein D